MKAIEDLMPHSGEMVLIDEILEIKEDFICVLAQINEDNAFLENRVFPTYKTLEMMAQSLVAFRGKGDEKNRNKLGFLLSTRYFEIFKPFVEVGDKIIIKTNITMQDNEGLGIYESKAYLRDELIASATLSVLNPNDEFLKKVLI
ncbi:MAG: thioester dehydrase [Helicobacter sp.]|nr:thioester dehydrase [Helicobacter sp.]